MQNLRHFKTVVKYYNLHIQLNLTNTIKFKNIIKFNKALNLSVKHFAFKKNREPNSREKSDTDFIKCFRIFVCSENMRG